MIGHEHAVLGFGIMIAAGATFAAVMGIMTLVGFMSGVAVTLVSAAIANAMEDFE